MRIYIFRLKKGLVVGIMVFIVIWVFVVSKIGELSEGMEREGFEFLVNKSLYSSFNVMFLIIWLFFLYNDYDLKIEWIVS